MEASKDGKGRNGRARKENAMKNVMPEFEVSAAESDSGVIEQVNFSVIVPTVKEAKAIAARFPKYLKVRACQITGDWSGEKGYVKLDAALSSDGVNKGVNEAGLKRARKFASLVSYKVTQPYLNAANQDKVQALLKGAR